MRDEFSRLAGRHAWAVAVTAACLCVTGRASGGVYLPAEPALAPSQNTPLFLNILNELRGLRNPQNPVRKRYLARVAELEERDRRGDLSVDERVDLSGYYLRLEEPEKAVAVLNAVAGAGSANFMVLSNLAAANELAGRLDRAISYSEQALRHWPELWPGLSRAELYWLGRVERYHLDLLKARYVEATRQTSRGGIPERPDVLFPRVTFDGTGAAYRAGDLDPTQLIELPNDGLLIVQQLLLWSPNDLRLHWQLAELINAQGGTDNIMTAYEILERLADRERYGNKLILAHRQVLKSAAESAKLLAQALNTGEEPNSLVRLLWYAQPRGTTLEPGAGALVTQTSWGARAYLVKKVRSASAPAPVESMPSAREPARPPVNWLADMRPAGVGFVAGLLVMLFGILQVREFRRRHAAAVTPKGEA